MSLVGRFFRWLGTPFRALTRHEARQALIYIIFGGAGPALTVIVIWAMTEALARQPLWSTFANLAYIVGAALLIIVSGLGMFVSIRAIKIGKDGFSAEGGNQDEELTPPEAARQVAEAADHKASEIEAEKKPC